MPYNGSRRKKTRTHKVPVESDYAEKVPKSFVLRRGKVESSVKELVEDVRQLMLPHTAAKLRERKSNTLKDFVSVANGLGVTHLCIFSQQPCGNVNLRIGRMPRGPTLTFRVESHTLSRQVKAAQRRPVDVAVAFESPPVVVLHNFSLAAAAATAAGGDAAAGTSGSQVATGVSVAEALKLVQTTFQAMLPAVNPATVRLKDCRRVLLVHRDKASGAFQLRQYIVRAAPVGVTRGVNKLLRGSRSGGSSGSLPPLGFSTTTSSSRLPNLSRLDDVAEYVLSGGHAGGGGGATSESEWEGDGDEAARVTLPADFAGAGNTRASVSSIKLAEVGPRLTLRLVKIEGGLCGGEVLHHAFITKTHEQAAELSKRAAARASLTVERKAVQERNVARKAAETAAAAAAKAARRGASQSAAERAAAEGRLGDDEEERAGADADDEDEGGGGEGGAPMEEEVEGEEEVMEAPRGGKKRGRQEEGGGAAPVATADTKRLRWADGGAGAAAAGVPARVMRRTAGDKRRTAGGGGGGVKAGKAGNSGARR